MHGRAEVCPLNDPANADLLQAMLDEYLPRGPAFEECLAEMDAVGVRIVPEKLFTFHMDSRADGHPGRTPASRSGQAWCGRSRACRRGGWAEEGKG